MEADIPRSCRWHSRLLLTVSNALAQLTDSRLRGALQNIPFEMYELRGYWLKALCPRVAATASSGATFDTTEADCRYLQHRQAVHEVAAGSCSIDRS